MRKIRLLSEGLPEAEASILCCSVLIYFIGVFLWIVVGFVVRYWEFCNFFFSQTNTFVNLAGRLSSAGCVVDPVERRLCEGASGLGRGEFRVVVGEHRCSRESLYPGQRAHRTSFRDPSSHVFSSLILTGLVWLACPLVSR